MTKRSRYYEQAEDDGVLHEALRVLAEAHRRSGKDSLSAARAAVEEPELAPLWGRSMAMRAGRTALVFVARLVGRIEQTLESDAELSEVLADIEEKAASAYFARFQDSAKLGALALLEETVEVLTEFYREFEDDLSRTLDEIQAECRDLVRRKLAPICPLLGNEELLTERALAELRDAKGKGGPRMAAYARVGEFTGESVSTLKRTLREARAEAEKPGFVPGDREWCLSGVRAPDAVGPMLRAAGERQDVAEACRRLARTMREHDLSLQDVAPMLAALADRRDDRDA